MGTVGMNTTDLLGTCVVIKVVGRRHFEVNVVGVSYFGVTE